MRMQRLLSREKVRGACNRIGQYQPDSAEEEDLGNEESENIRWHEEKSHRLKNAGCSEHGDADFDCPVDTAS